MSTPTTQTRCKDEVSTTLTSARADDSGFRLGLRLVMLLFLIASFWEALSVFLARKGADDSKPCLGDRSAELWLQNQAIQAPHKVISVCGLARNMLVRQVRTPVKYTHRGPARHQKFSKPRTHQEFAWNFWQP
jgi:hypothetical protein